MGNAGESFCPCGVRVLRNGLPFDVAIPNETTRRTFDQTDAGQDLVACEDPEDMFRKLGI